MWCVRCRVIAPRFRSCFHGETPTHEDWSQIYPPKYFFQNVLSWIAETLYKGRRAFSGDSKLAWPWLFPRRLSSTVENKEQAVDDGLCSCSAQRLPRLLNNEQLCRRMPHGFRKET